NGYMSEEACEEMVTFIDAFNIDLKSFSDKFYKEICGGGLDLVLDNLKTVYKTKNDLNNGRGPHLEITTLLIGDLNTSKEEIRQLCEFVYYELDKKVPLHFSRFFPQYKMADIPATDSKLLIRAKEIAKDVGLEYVYLGNMPADNNSYCPNCGELLIERNGFSVKGIKRIKKGRCLTCGHELNFI
ncbi:MAG: AmmeMemoRadiSam system radical SAM enzyme, partial [Methanobrevibacter sp.]|nr:AmmeMemoRadiSam system radical SAM enzyme [Methanobrevibacter sp.]